MSRLIAAAVALLTFATPAVAGGDSPDQSAVRTTFTAYKKALLAKDGTAAAKLVDRSTIAYYETIRRKALRAKARQVKQLNIVDRLMVLTFRVRVPVAKLRSLSARQLFALAVDSGMVGRNGVTNSAIGAVRIRGKNATGQMISRGKKAPIKWQFRKENGRWKLDLMPLMKLGNAAMKTIVKRAGKPENEVLFLLIEMTSGKKVTSTVWNPPK